MIPRQVPEEPTTGQRESTGGHQGLAVRGNREVVSIGFRVSAWEEEEVLEMEGGGDGHRYNRNVLNECPLGCIFFLVVLRGMGS